MKNNILGGLVIFMVVVTCLLIIDDITQPKNKSVTEKSAEVEQVENPMDLAVIENQ